MAAISPEQAAQAYSKGVQDVSMEKYCRKQIRLGVRPDVCAQRFNDYQADVQGKGQKWLTNWQNG